MLFMAATVYLPTINLLQQIGARGVKTVSKTEYRSLRQGRVSPRLLRWESPQRTLLHPALRAAEAFRHVLEPSVPAAKSPQRARFRGALVAARSALEHQRVLTKLIAQLVDVKSGRHAADCHETTVARPSSTGIMKTLYEPSFTATAADGRHGFAMTPQVRPNHTVVVRASPLERTRLVMSIERTKRLEKRIGPAVRAAVL